MFFKVGVSKDVVDVAMNINSFHSVDPERIPYRQGLGLGLGPYVYCVCGSPFHINFFLYKLVLLGIVSCLRSSCYCVLVPLDWIHCFGPGP